jgi:hypothetical protein
MAVCISDSYAYVACEDSGLHVIDISDPSNPQEIGVYDVFGSYRDIHVSGSYAYIANEHSMLVVVDVSDPANPQEAGYYSLPNLAYGVFATDLYAFVATYRCGLQIFRNLLVGIQEYSKRSVRRSGLRLLRNPVLGSCMEIMLLATGRDDATLSMYNTAGQKVWSFTFTALSQGEHKVLLNTETIPAGAYFLRLDNAANHETVKISVLK